VHAAASTEKAYAHTPLQPNRGLAITNFLATGSQKTRAFLLYN
jgi:hypothetical protein